MNHSLHACVTLRTCIRFDRWRVEFPLTRFFCYIASDVRNEKWLICIPLSAYKFIMQHNEVSKKVQNTQITTVGGLLARQCYASQYATTYRQMLSGSTQCTYRCGNTVLPSQVSNHNHLAGYRWRAHGCSNPLQCTHRTVRLANRSGSFRQHTHKQ